MAVVKPICWLFNNILDTSCIPKSWKLARIVPIHKKGSKTDVNNFRPISNISSMSKLFERCLSNRIKLKDPDNIFGEHQHAFRVGSSTTTACLTLQDYLATKLDQSYKAILYSIDLTAAFDLLRPNLLIQKLLNLNVENYIIRCILSFLSGRKAFVDVNGSNSNIFKIGVGCVQGSVLGPLLFNIYMHDLADKIKELNSESFTLAYADDTYVVLPFKDNINQAKTDLENIFTGHVTWLEKLGMICNPSKTEIMILGFKNALPTFILNNNPVKPVSKMKILGVTFDSMLSWDAQVNQVIKKANSVGYSLRILRHVLPDTLFLRVVQSNFLCHFVYGSPVWAGFLTQRQCQKLDRVIFKIYRFYCRDFKRLLSRFEVCRRTRLRSFNSLRLINDAIMLHRFYSDPSNTTITIRFIDQAFSLSRFPDRIGFFDTSQKRIGKSSFVNRSKYIAETIPFIWSNMTHDLFKTKIKAAIPLML